MMSDYFFEELRSHALKEYKFQQRKHNPAFGVCLPLTLMWIKEKLTDGIFARLLRGERMFSASSSGVGVHARNGSTMAQAARSQVSGTGVDMSPLEREFGLVPTHHTLALSYRRDSNNIRVVDFATTLAHAGAELRHGQAVCVEVEVRRADEKIAGHAIAMYRSRGGKLHFFDSNAGVYTVHDLQGFMQAWIEGCARRGWRIEPFIRFGDDHSWYHTYQR
jgi:hypothetical protein